MRQFVRFWKLPAAERCLLLSALCHLVAVEAGLWALPLQQLLERLPQAAAAGGAGRAGNAPPAERIAWAVRVAGRYLPGAGNCLVQSLVAQAMLARRGYVSRLRLGVAHGDGGQFQAHAWVECDGQVIVGAEEVSRYAAFPPLEVGRR